MRSVEKHISMILASAFIFLLLLTPIQAQTTASRNDVSTLLSDADNLIATIDNQLESAKILEQMIVPCPSEDDYDECTAAQNTATVLIANLVSKRDRAKGMLESAQSNFEGGASVSEVLAGVNDSLTLINEGIQLAIANTNKIPANCPDDNGLDLCEAANFQIPEYIATVSGEYRDVKAEHDNLARTETVVIVKPELTEEQKEDQDRNQKLNDAYIKQKNLKNMYSQMRALGTSEVDVILHGTIEEAKTYTALADAALKLRQNISATYDTLLQNPRYEHNFWVNWDYATLHAIAGNKDMAWLYYTNSIADLPEKDQKIMIEDMKLNNMARLGWKEDYSKGKLKQTISKQILNKIESSWPVTEFKVQYGRALAIWAANDQKAQELKDKWRSLFSGESLGDSAEQAKNQ